ncbi:MULTISPECIES: hypothetical protein [unclassified Methylibium]|uniref:hypothetical protein n=1 Tax=unclassified Methylibium TaxID=2633235 RepID=UPI001268FE8E|nr:MULTISPECIES: hypothetical protein [unclassified Methylibium]
MALLPDSTPADHVLAAGRLALRVDKPQLANRLFGIADLQHPLGAPDDLAQAQATLATAQRMRQPRGHHCA